MRLVGRVGDGELRTPRQLVEHGEIGRVDPVGSQPHPFDHAEADDEHDQGRRAPTATASRRPSRGLDPAISSRNSATGRRWSAPLPESSRLGSTR